MVLLPGSGYYFSMDVSLSLVDVNLVNVSCMYTVCMASR